MYKKEIKLHLGVIAFVQTILIVLAIYCFGCSTTPSKVRSQITDKQRIEFHDFCEEFRGWSVAENPKKRGNKIIVVITSPPEIFPRVIYHKTTINPLFLYLSEGDILNQLSPSQRKQKENNNEKKKLQ